MNQPAHTPAPVVRAVDVGFGNVKHVVRHEKGSDVECRLFPSLAPQVAANGSLSAGPLTQRNTTRVKVKGMTYEVGVDAELAIDTTHGRVLDRSYPTTDVYMALLRGALAYMMEPKIDLLVLGLPVNTYEQHREFLQAEMTGDHVVQNMHKRVDPAAAEEITVNVAEIWVLPQPIGGFFDHAIRHKLFGQMKNQTNLIVDVGFFTLDWLVAAGTKPVGARSGAANGGMSAVLTAIGEAIGREHTTQIANLKRIDDAIRAGGKLNIFGKPHDISSNVAIGKAKAREFVSTMAAKVGDGADIDNIILSGGGAEFFIDIVQEKFPKHELVIAHDPVFANVRGFQLAGEERIGAQRVATARQRA